MKVEHRRLSTVPTFIIHSTNNEFFGGIIQVQFMCRRFNSKTVNGVDDDITPQLIARDWNIHIGFSYNL